MKRILVLCTHNSARSQMAEGWIRHFSSQKKLDVEVWSAGTYYNFSYTGAQNFWEK